jgi:TolB-like protein/Flp pilus assembly protein TadD
MMPAMQILTAARKAVPAVDYALGAAGVAAASAIIVGLLGYTRTAWIVFGGTLIAMVLLFAFARLVAAQSPTITLAGVVLLWAITVFFCVFLIFTVTAFAFLWPDPWADFIGVHKPSNVTDARHGPNPRLDHIAVVPFRNVNQEKSIDQLSREMPIALVSELTRRSSLFVVPFCSSERLGATAARDVGRALNVGAMVDGSYWLSGQRLDVQVHLIDANRDYILWSWSFDDARSRISDLVEEMVRKIASVLNASFESTADPRHPRTRNPDAYESYLHGLVADLEITEENNRVAINSFERAVSLDPGFSEAHAALADALVTHYWWNFSNDASWVSRAETSARRALQLNPRLAEAHYALGCSLEAKGKRLEAAREYFVSVRAGPRCVPALSSAARYYFYMADFGQALTTLDTIANIDPTVNVHVRRAMCLYFSGDLRGSLRDNEKAEKRAQGVDQLTLVAFTYVWLKEFTSAERVLDRLEREHPGAFSIAEVRAWLYTARGQLPLAEEQIKQMMAGGQSRFGIVDEIATLYALQGNGEQAITWLERAVAMGAPNYAWYNSDFFSVLRGNPRYQSVLKRLNGEYQTLRESPPQ